MNEIEKNRLLAEDLSARVPFGVKIDLGHEYDDEREVATLVGILPTDDRFFYETEYKFSDADGIPTPYLRRMESMTKEEFDEYDKENEKDTADSHKAIKENLKGRKYISSWYHGVLWLYKHHFDFRGLIDMGLSIEVTPENNPYTED